MQKKRYPGVRPFETTDKDLFFGRERDVQDLSVLIALEQLVVLFGKSGYGKSSLINAGLIPELMETEDADETQIQPIVVRLGSYIEDASLSPMDNLLQRLSEKTEDNAGSSFLEALLPEPTLWYHFKRKSQGPSRFLLIFDQFEEFFTYPLVQQEIFKTQLSELLYAALPQAVRTSAPNLNQTQRRFLADPLEVKVLFAIRSDRMSQLDSMKDHLPAILHKRFELKGLSEEQAREAIENPAQKQGDYNTPLFTYSPEALRLMLQKLSESRQQAQMPGIEAFQLQILCEYLEEEILAGRIPQNRVQSIHFAYKINDIYEGYYQRLVDKLPKQTAKAAQQLIEESLIFSDDKTGESRRLSVDADVLVQRYIEAGVTHATLRALENAFLLRREANSVGGFSYEVSHDTLVGAIISRKQEREQEEETKLVVIREQQRRKKETKQRLRLAGAVVLAILGFGLAGLAWNKSIEAEMQQKNAEEARNVALQAKKEAENSLTALQNEQKRSKANDYENYGDSYFNLGKFQDALENYQKAIEQTPDNIKIKQKIMICLSKIKN